MSPEGRKRAPNTRVMLVMLHDYKRSMRLQHDRAFSKLVDRPSIGTKRKAANVRMDTSAPCAYCHGTGKNLLGGKCEFGDCPTCDGVGRKNDKLCLTCGGTSEVKSCGGTGRVTLDALNTTKHVNGKANGLIVTPSAYAQWIKAGKPAHPVFNVKAWHAERYVNGVALPTCGLLPAPVVNRHSQDCECVICHEFQNRIQQVPATKIDPAVLGPLHGPWFRPTLVRPPIRPPLAKQM